MPQYKRVGHDFTMEMPANANAEYWEPVPEKKPATPKAPEAAPEGSDA